MRYEISKYKLNFNKNNDYFFQFIALNKKIENFTIVSFEVDIESLLVKVNYIIGTKIINEFIFKNIPKEHIILINSKNFILIQEFKKKNKSFHYNAVKM